MLYQKLAKETHFTGLGIFVFIKIRKEEINIQIPKYTSFPIKSTNFHHEITISNKGSLTN
jgi:hypothetical protein